jgi:hypothetical protein
MADFTLLWILERLLELPETEEVLIERLVEMNNLHEKENWQPDIALRLYLYYLSRLRVKSQGADNEQLTLLTTLHSMWQEGKFALTPEQQALFQVTLPDLILKVSCRRGAAFWHPCPEGGGRATCGLSSNNDRNAPQKPISILPLCRHALS